jgi:hypothetical protein
VAAANDAAAIVVSEIKALPVSGTLLPEWVFSGIFGFFMLVCRKFARHTAQVGDTAGSGASCAADVRATTCPARCKANCEASERK